MVGCRDPAPRWARRIEESYDQVPLVALDGPRHWSRSYLQVGSDLVGIIRSVTRCTDGGDDRESAGRRALLRCGLVGCCMPKQAARCPRVVVAIQALRAEGVI